MSELSVSTLENLGLYRANNTQAAQQSNQALGQSDFLKLMTVQLSSQDPFEPMDNTGFIAQMAQFSSLTGVENLSKSFETLAQTLSQNQTLQAASLVGNEVLVPMTSRTRTAEQTVSGAIDVPASMGGVAINVTDATGQLVRRIDMGTLAAGLHDFQWDGLTDAGVAAPAGQYQFAVTTTNTTSTTPATVCLNTPVESVTVNTDGGLQLNVADLGAVDFSTVRRVN